MSLNAILKHYNLDEQCIHFSQESFALALHSSLAYWNRASEDTKESDSPLPIWAVIGDIVAQEGDIERAIEFYHLSIFFFDGPEGQRLLSQRVGQGADAAIAIEALVATGRHLLKCWGEKSLTAWSAFGDDFANYDEVSTLEKSLTEELVSPFRESEKVLTLSLEAFGYAWLRYERKRSLWLQGSEYASAPFFDDDVAAILTLDGLRIAFRHLQDADGLAFARHEFEALATAWDDDDSWETVQNLEIAFRETTAFMEGLGAASGARTTADAAEEFMLRRQQWQTTMETVSSQLKDSDEKSAVLVFEQFRNIVAQLMVVNPDEEIRVSSNRAESAVGPSWSRLPEPVRCLLVDAEFLRPHLLGARRGWYPVVLAWAKSVEGLLHLLGPELDRLDPRSIGRPRYSQSWSDGTIGDYVSLLRDISRRRAPGLTRNILAAARLSPHLSELNKVRLPSAHGYTEVSSQEAHRIYDLLFGSTRLLPQLAEIVC